MDDELAKELASFATEIYDFDSGDPWGSVMRVAFSCAENLHRRESAVPSAWEFRPGLGYDDELIVWPYTDYSETRLVELGNSAMELRDRLEAAGLSY